MLNTVAVLLVLVGGQRPREVLQIKTANAQARRGSRHPSGEHVVAQVDHWPSSPRPPSAP